jgi:hypothetical protein
MSLQWLKWCAIGTGLAVGVSSTANAEPFAYTVNSNDSSGNGDALYRIDLATGVASRIGPLSGSATSAFDDVEGLAFDKNGLLFGVDDLSKSLIQINPANGLGQAVRNAVGNLNLPASSQPIDNPSTAFQCDGTSLVASQIRKTLFRVGLTAPGTITVGSAGSLGINVVDLATSPNGDVFALGGSGDEGLYRVNTTLGTVSRIGTASWSGLRFESGGLAFDAQGNAWGVADMTAESATAPSVIFKIDTTTGIATRTGTTIAGIESLSIAGSVCSQPDGGPITIVARKAPANNLFGLAMIALGLLLLALKADPFKRS